MQVCVTCNFTCLHKLIDVYEIDGDQTQSAPNQSPQSLNGESRSGGNSRSSKLAEEEDNEMVEQPSFGNSSFADSSLPFFSIYTEATKKVDDEMVERWQKDADGILIFVSHCVGIHVVLCINSNAIDRFIFCFRCCAPCYNRPGPEAKQPGHFCILSREHLWGSDRPECNSCFHPLPCC